VSEIFPEPIRDLPKADIPLDGAYRLRDSIHFEGAGIRACVLLFLVL